MRFVSGALAVALLVAVALTGCARGAGPVGSEPTTTVPSATVRPTESFVVHGTGTAAPPGKEELQDLQTYAKSSGEPLARVLAQQRGSAEFRALANALEAEPGSGIVQGGRHLGRTGSTGYLTFTDRPDAATVARIAALPIDTTVTSGLPLPHAELVEYSEAIAGALEGVPGARLVGEGPSELGEAVEVQYRVTGTPPTAEALQAAALRVTRPWSVDGTLRVPVRFTLVTGGEAITPLLAGSAS